MQRISITNPQNVINGTAKKYYFRLRNTGGPKGDKGDKGDTGATGPQGPQGNAATVSVGSTTTLPVGYDATVTNTGSVYNAVLDFGIPQGPQGPQGAKGDKGDTGAKGDTGPRGPQGERGTNATVYIGTTSTLAPGSQATVYNSGSDSNAVLNFGIPQGAKGDTGSQGPQGPAGQNFAPTVVAELPATGDESKLYLTPKSHTSQTATGNPITASISDGAGSMESFQLDGDTYQQTYTGKNLFIGQNYEQGYLGTSGRVESSNSSVTCVDYIPVNAGTHYQLSWVAVANGSVARGVAFYDSSKAYISRISGSDFTGAFTAPSDTAFARLYFYNANGMVVSSFPSSYMTDIQLEVGNSATSYEPYVGGIPAPNPSYPEPIQTVTETQTISINDTDYPLNLGSVELCKLGTYQDYIYKDGENWKVHKAVSKYTFDGQENWTYDSTTPRIYLTSGTLDALGITPAIPATSFDMPVGVMNKYIAKTFRAFYTDAGSNGFAMSTTGQNVQIGSKEWADEEDARADANGTTWYYGLRTGTTTDTVITDSALIAQLEAIRTAALENGANTISNEATGSNLAGDMEISYYGYNPTNRYDKWLWLDLNNNYEQIGE